MRGCTLRDGGGADDLGLLAAAVVVYASTEPSRLNVGYGYVAPRRRITANPRKEKLMLRQVSCGAQFQRDVILRAGLHAYCTAAIKVEFLPLAHLGNRTKLHHHWRLRLAGTGLAAFGR